jgi:hypothetical protein
MKNSDTLSAKDVEEIFKAELKALLRKWNGLGEFNTAEIEAFDGKRGRLALSIYIPGVWDKDGNMIRECALFELPRHCVDHRDL